MTRVRPANDRALAPERDFVLYWMIAARRPRYNFALDRAVAHARALDKPLVILEALRVGYEWASDRLHRFVIDGMRANAAAFANAAVTYYPYLEPRPGAGSGLLAALAGHACVVVTDEFPCFFLPRMVAAAARTIDARLEVVDSNGLLPLAASPKAYPSAAHYRRHAQKLLPAAIADGPRARLAGKLRTLDRLPRAIEKRWPSTLDVELSSLPIDHEVGPVALRGGWQAAHAALRRFVDDRLDRYHELHSEVDADATSKLSPYLHFGHLSPHEIFHAVAPELDLARLARKKVTGAREGWWGLGRGAEAFLDQLVIWRELAYNGCARIEDYDHYSSLPPWARASLDQHARDPRPHRYTAAQLEAGQTHDPLWNAAQGQLRVEGWFHNYLRMLWGKKILEWSPSPKAALATMIRIMNRWSLDGRNPNSYAGYAWTLGRYDRPWPERPIYGVVRTMSSERTAKKVHVERTVARYTRGA